LLEPPKEKKGGKEKKKPDAKEGKDAKEGQDAKGEKKLEKRYAYMVPNPAYKKWRNRVYNQGKDTAGEEPPEYVNCPTCKAVGVLGCKYCKGTRKRVCKTCKATGKVRRSGACPDCSGRKRVACSDCTSIEGEGAETIPEHLNTLKSLGAIDSGEYWKLLRGAAARSRGKKKDAGGLTLSKEVLKEAEEGWEDLPVEKRGKALAALLKACADGAADLQTYLAKQRVSGLESKEVEALEEEASGSWPVLKRYRDLKNRFHQGKLTHDQYEKALNALAAP
jgi:hypothetical protein